MNLFSAAKRILREMSTTSENYNEAQNLAFKKMPLDVQSTLLPQLKEIVSHILSDENSHNKPTKEDISRRLWHATMETAIKNGCEKSLNIGSEIGGDLSQLLEMTIKLQNPILIKILLDNSADPSNDMKESGRNGDTIDNISYISYTLRSDSDNETKERIICDLLDSDGKMHNTLPNLVLNSKLIKNTLNINDLWNNNSVISKEEYDMAKSIKENKGGSSFEHLAEARVKIEVTSSINREALRYEANENINNLPSPSPK